MAAGPVPSLDAYLSEQRAAVSRRLREVAEHGRNALSAVHPDGGELVDRILSFCLRGKLIRGCLVRLGWDLFEDRAGAAGEEAVLDGAAAMELVQSGLLVHDDIMDRDFVRRGAPTVHSRYGAEEAAAGVPDPAHVGEALGICAGDACFFLAFETLSRASAPAALRAEAVRRLAEVLSAVSLAQMLDVRWGAENPEVPEEDVLSMYLWKTARYSFSVPLALGAVLAGAPPESVARLEEYGEHVGIAFQLRDDELGLFGEEAEIGKPVGSDVREGKKTVLRARLLAAAPETERGRLRSLFGSPVGAADLAYLREKAEALGARRAVAALAVSRLARARGLLADIPGTRPAAVRLLGDLAASMASRRA